MVLATLIGQKTGPTIGDITVDVSISETHTVNNQITEHPIETGASVSDHVRQLPDGLTMTGVLSNTPGRVADVVALQTTGNTAQRRYEQLRTLAKSRDVIDVFTTLTSYKNMVIESLSVPRNRGQGSNITFTATLRQLRFTDALEAIPLITNRTDAPTISKRAKVGTKAKTPASATTTERSQSILSRLTGGRQGASATAGLLGGN